MNLKKELKLKDGTIYSKGERFCVNRPDQDRPTIATIDHLESGRQIKIPSARLHKYFPGFKAPKASMMDPDFDSAICESIKGGICEPDGGDDAGWPSVLLAAGMI